MSLYDEDIFARSLLEARDKARLAFPTGLALSMTHNAVYIPSYSVYHNMLFAVQEKKHPNVRQPFENTAQYHTFFSAWFRTT